MDRWICLEDHICPRCNHPYMVKITTQLNDRVELDSRIDLTVIESCACDSCVYREDWAAAVSNGSHAIVSKITTHDVLKMIMNG